MPKSNTIVVDADFKRVGGYDEVIQGWGKEDEDFYARLTLAGLQDSSFPGEVLQTIGQGDGGELSTRSQSSRAS